ncbi:MAG: hypothetical protein NWR67_13455, partial [Saprospiraceae bacterium]|nr:hypothetical protein [Saprospiraceae bacterium]
MGIAHRKGERSQAMKGRNTIPFGIREFMVRPAVSYFPHEKSHSLPDKLQDIKPRTWLRKVVTFWEEKVLIRVIQVEGTLRWLPPEL